MSEVYDDILACHSPLRTSHWRPTMLLTAHNKLTATDSGGSSDRTF